ncbi:MAG TPA: DNA primase [Bacteroidetes bacterium]|nr:DNA primase [Bacteroidota bacterium]
MRIPSGKIEEIRAAADIFDVVSGYVGLKRRGQNYFGLCPFHTEKTPSFSVNPQKQIFHCFGCGEGGNSISFIMKIENLSFVESAKLLAERYHIQIPESKETDEKEKAKLALYDVNRFATDFFVRQLWSPAGKAALTYLQKRHFSEEVIREFELGFALSSWDALIKEALKFGFSNEQLKAVGLVIPNKKGGYYDRFRERIMFPIHNVSGLIVGFGGRILQDRPDSPKYINSPETAIYRKSRILYGLFQNRETIRKREKSLLVEGYADVLGLSQAGIKNAVASSGTALTTEQARLLLRYAPNTIILYDGDLAGANASLRGVDILLQEGLQVKVAVLPEGSDPDSFVKEKSVDELKIILSKARELIDFKIYAFTAGNPLQSPQQKAALVNMLAESVGNIHDEVMRNLYIQEIARRLNLSETVIFRAVSKKKRFGKKQEDSVPAMPAREIHGVRFQAEREILEILLRFPKMIPAVYHHLELDELKYPEHRQVMMEIYEQYVNTGRINPQHVLDFVENGELQKYIVAVLVKEEEVAENVLNQWTSDCIRSIKINNLHIKAAEARTTLKEYEIKKNGKKVLELSQTYAKMCRDIEQLKKKVFLSGEEERL